ncbi:MAG: hypothetical protein JWQ21_996, partial [Herminiimonas sp.]|nr:hypothetical protein [Herminiimonas sp.]
MDGSALFQVAHLCGPSKAILDLKHATITVEMREKNDYMQAGKPVHRLSFCAFLDVLGFSARIRESYKDKSSNKLLQEFHAVFGKLISELESQSRDSRLYYKSFSDNVLLAVPRYSPDMESESGNILIATSEYQFQLALKGFFVRGGISVGPL